MTTLGTGIAHARRTRAEARQLRAESALGLGLTAKTSSSKCARQINDALIEDGSYTFSVPLDRAGNGIIPRLNALFRLKALDLPELTISDIEAATSYRAMKGVLAEKGLELTVTNVENQEIRATSLSDYFRNTRSDIDIA
ncbi:MAG: hypothetical protein ACPGRX_03920, partial [Bdellovibrionales bacterium]